MAFPETAKGEGPVLETVQKIAEDEFFGAIEVTAIKDPAVRAQVASLLSTSGMAVGFGGQPFELGNKLDINSVDSTKRQYALDQLKGTIDQAHELGATRFAVLSGPYPGEALEKQAMDAIVDSLNQLCAYAETKNGMGVVIEVFDRTIDKKALIGPTSSGVAVSRAVRQKHPSFGLMMDFSHLPLQFETSEQALSAAKGDIVHAHIGNCVLADRTSKLYGDYHPRFGHPLGANSIADLTEYLRMLLEIGYIGEGNQNIVAMEVKPYDAETGARGHRWRQASANGGLGPAVGKGRTGNLDPIRFS